MSHESVYPDYGVNKASVLNIDKSSFDPQALDLCIVNHCLIFLMNGY